MIPSLKSKPELDPPPKLMQLKSSYNTLLKRYKELETYIDDHSVSFAERENRIGTFKDILHQLNQHILAIQDTDYSMTQQEILYGFKL